MFVPIAMRGVVFEAAREQGRDRVTTNGLQDAVEHNVELARRQELEAREDAMRMDAQGMVVSLGLQVGTAAAELGCPEGREDPGPAQRLKALAGAIGDAHAEVQQEAHRRQGEATTVVRDLVEAQRGVGQHEGMANVWAMARSFA